MNEGPHLVSVGERAGAPESPARSPFDCLLAYLDPDRERAGERYEAIRRQLVKFFECRGCPHAEDRADEAIDRVARRIAEGEEIQTTDPGAYFYGVARNVLREFWRRRRREPSFQDVGRPVRGPLIRRTGPEGPVLDSGRDADLLGQELACLEQCLESLAREDRDLILWYYQRGERVMIQSRKELAGHLGIPLNALRIRAHRIRARLETCVRKRLSLLENRPREIDLGLSTRWRRRGGGAR